MIDAIKIAGPLACFVLFILLVTHTLDKSDEEKNERLYPISPAQPIFRVIDLPPVEPEPPVIGIRV